MSKFDSILKKSNEIKDFKTYDIDSEWDQFKSTLDLENQEVISLDKKPRPLYTLIVSIAAAAVLLIFAFIFFLKPDADTRETIVALKGDSTIYLVDGSIIHAKKGATLDFPTTLKGLKERKINLKGDADFDVTKSILPFNVYYDNFLVQVVGTSFNLRLLDSIYTFSVTEGVVNVKHLHSNQSITLQKGDNYQFNLGLFENLNEILLLDDDDDDHGKLLGSEKEENESTRKIAKKKTKPNAEAKGSTYTLDSVLKNYLKKFNKNSIKIDKKFKYDKELRVKLDLNANMVEVLNSLKAQGVINYTSGECDGCYLITAPEK